MGRLYKCIVEGCIEDFYVIECNGWWWWWWGGGVTFLSVVEIYQAYIGACPKTNTTYSHFP